MAYKADPITMQVIRYAMEQVADEMGRTLVRTGRSTVIKEIEDITCAVFDKYGNTVGPGPPRPHAAHWLRVAHAQLASALSGRGTARG
jgi:N-methylhydantoinase B/oxoprolinase/acetone carboxylase alpha subunit